MESTVKNFMFTENSGTRDDGTIVTYVSTAATISTWLTSIVANGMFKDPKCGDGVCQFPQEYIQFNAATTSYGCAADCGEHVLDITATEVYLEGQFVSASENRGHLWNVCREFETVCWYEEDQPFADQTSLSPNVTVSMNLMDGQWLVRIHDSSASGGVKGYVKATVNVVDPTNATIAVPNTILTNFSACTSGSQKAPATVVGTRSISFDLTATVNVDSSVVPAATMERMQQSLASWYGVSNNQITLVHTGNARRGLSNQKFEVNVLVFTIVVPATSFTVNQVNAHLAAGTKTISGVTGVTTGTVKVSETPGGDPPPPPAGAGAGAGPASLNSSNSSGPGGRRLLKATPLMRIPNIQRVGGGRKLLQIPPGALAPGAGPGGAFHLLYTI